jgi:hypothetical protein
MCLKQGDAIQIWQASRLKPCAVTARLMVQRSDLLKFDQARDKTSSPPYFECSSLQLIPNSLEHQ